MDRVAGESNTQSPPTAPSDVLSSGSASEQGRYITIHTYSIAYIVQSILPRRIRPQRHFSLSTLARLPKPARLQCPSLRYHVALRHLAERLPSRHLRHLLPLLSTTLLKYPRAPRLVHLNSPPTIRLSSCKKLWRRARRMRCRWDWLR